MKLLNYQKQRRNIMVDEAQWFEREIRLCIAGLIKKQKNNVDNKISMSTVIKELKRIEDKYSSRIRVLR